MSTLTFNTDAMATIGRAVSANMPLMMLIKDDDAVSEKWIDDLIMRNDNVQEQTRTTLIDKFITLQLKKGSQEFVNLVAVMPVFQNAITPCLFFIFKGQVVDYIPKDADPTGIDEKLLSVYKIVTASVESGNILNNSEAVTGSTADEIPTPATQFQSQAPPAQYYSPSPQPPTTATVQTPAPAPATNQPPAVAPISESTVNSSKRQQNTSGRDVKKTLKEESNDLAARIYQQNLLKQRQQTKEDRQRILRLMEQDKLEKQRKDIKQDKPEEAHENLYNPKLVNSPQYTIQLKMIDGSIIRHQFPSTAKLSAVRDYVLEEYPDYLAIDFYFFNVVERITYGESNENMTLNMLNLNMTTLILKPIEHERFATAYAASPAESKLSWMKNKMSSLIWGDNGTGNIELPDRSSSPAIRPHNNIDEESDHGSVYHTPVLTHTASSSNLVPVVSSFNLYGSLQHNDSFVNSDPQAPLGESQELLDDRDESMSQDEINFHNGNSISLRFPDEPK